jgi:uncharacterized protein (DUF1697 family)
MRPQAVRHPSAKLSGAYHFRRKTQARMPATSSYIALLRGINVGKGNRIAMADLRDALQSAGFANVRTLLASGNVVMDAPEATPQKIARDIEAVLSTKLSIDTKVVAVSTRTVESAIANNPLAPQITDLSRSLIFFARDAKELSAFLPLRKEDWAPEAFALNKHAAYLWCPEGISAGKLAEAAFKLMPQASTSRNVNTLMKLLDLART